MTHIIAASVTSCIQSKSLLQDTLEHAIKKKGNLNVLPNKRFLLSNNPARKAMLPVKVMMTKMQVTTVTQTLLHISPAMYVARLSQHPKFLRIISDSTWAKNLMNVQNVVDVFSSNPSWSSISVCTSLSFSVNYVARVLYLCLHCGNISPLMARVAPIVVPSVSSVSQEPHSWQNTCLTTVRRTFLVTYAIRFSLQK